MSVSLWHSGRCQTVWQPPPPVQCEGEGTQQDGTVLRLLFGYRSNQFADVAMAHALGRLSPQHHDLSCGQQEQKVHICSRRSCRESFQCCFKHQAVLCPGIVDMVL